MKKNKLLPWVTPDDVRKMTNDELNVLCDELRSFIYETVSKTGGHLSSNLGAIEATVGLCHVFDFTKDKIIFDVGHQCYAYKALTGRAEKFDTLRKEGGLSGFPKRTESKFDFYDTGHAGTSVSAAIGYAKARDLKKEDYAVIAFIGDGSFNNGLIYEALNSLKILDTKILIVLNDNGMSISPTEGGMHEILSAIRGASEEFSADDTEKFVSSEPKATAEGKTERKAACAENSAETNAETRDESAKRAEKAKKDGVRLLESFKLKYLGVVDGNEADEVVVALKKAKRLLKDGSVLLHLVTKKGKGYGFCEEHPAATHGVPPEGAKVAQEYSQILGEELKKMAAKNGKIVAVTAAMTDALGLREFFDIYPDRAFDVGICEENAAVLCAALAAGGMKPYYAIYSTFLQRAYDEIIHDVCAQDLPVTFCIDRAGISGADGETHQGVFDLSYLSMIPNLTIVAPKDTEEFRKFVRWSEKFEHPLAIRYPRCGKMPFSKADGKIEGVKKRCAAKKISHGKWEYLIEEKNAAVTLIAAGERCLREAISAYRALKEKGKTGVNVVNGRFVKPIDKELLSDLRGAVITIEDNVLNGGFGSMVERELLLQDEDKSPEEKRAFKAFAYKDSFIPQGEVDRLRQLYGVSAEEIAAYAEKFL